VSAGVVVLATLLAGGFGAVVRTAVVARSPRVGVSAVNLAGTTLLAVTLVAHGRGAIGVGMTVVLAVGLSGSLTTFSGWMAVLDDGLRARPLRTLLLDLLLPLGLAVAITVLAFAAFA
jgi:fluoride ion exporter CrcB/FEX